MSPGISIKCIYQDADAFQLSIKASSGTFSGCCQPYTSSEELIAIGRELEAFPQHSSAKITFPFSELLHDPVSYLCVFLRHPSGKVAVACHFIGGSSEFRGTASFFIFTEVAQINEAGRNLCEMMKDTSKEIFIRHEE